MSAQQDSADQELEGTQSTGIIEGVDRQLTPLQYFYLSLLQRAVAVENNYPNDPGYEPWLMEAIKKAIYSTLRDCIEANIGEEAKDLLQREHQVN